MRKNKQNASELYKVGQKINLQMLPPQKGRKPIGRTEEGFICLISFDSKGIFNHYSTWECEIKEVHETKLIISPVNLLVTAAAEKHNAILKAKQAFGGGNKQQRKRKYQY